MRFDDQLCVQRSNLWEILLDLLLARLCVLVCLCALRHLLWHHGLLVEDPKIDTGHPDSARPQERGAEDAALLDVLPFC